MCSNSLIQFGELHEDRMDGTSSIAFGVVVFRALIRCQLSESVYYDF